MNTLTHFRSYGAQAFRLQIKGILGKGRLGEETQLMLTDGEFWINMDVSENIKEDIQNEVLGVHDIVEVWKTVGVLHNITLVSFVSQFTLFWCIIFPYFFSMLEAYSNLIQTIGN